MIVSKSALQVVGLTVADKQIPVLDTVRFESDGTVVGSNRECVLCVSPVKAEVESKLPLKSKGETAVTLSSETVRDAIKYIGVDKKFEGLLEHCDVTMGSSGDAVLTMYDGRRTKALQAKPYPKDYYDYKDLLRTVNVKGIKARVLLNRKRLTLMLETLNRVCQDGSDFAFLFAEFTNDGDMIVKSINRRTGQRVLGVVRGVPVKSVDTQWLVSDPWQDRLLPPTLSLTPSPTVPTKGPTMAVKRVSCPATVVPIVSATLTPPKYVRPRRVIVPGKSVVSSGGRQWVISTHLCKKCGNHLRVDLSNSKLSCSFVKCSDYRV